MVVFAGNKLGGSLPSSAECKPTLCIPNVSHGSDAGLPELLGVSSHDF